LRRTITRYLPTAAACLYKDKKRDTSMKKLATPFMALSLLALPAMAYAQDYEGAVKASSERAMNGVANFFIDVSLFLSL
jgi:hypothetical protein